MLFSFDRTNFPLIIVEEAAVEVHLLPVTKWQFKQFMAESGEVGDQQYQDMLALNLDVALDQFTTDEREHLFLTGVLPQEALAFARWLGEGFDLPTLKEWRAIYTALRAMSLPHHSLSSVLTAGPAAVMLAELSTQHRLRSMLDYSLMKGGVVEWAKQEKTWVGVGAPRSQFQPNLWNPLTNEVNPIHLEQRVPYFGFRLVRRGEWYLADRENVRYVY